MQNKDRNLFLQNAGSKDLNRYFHLLQKLATKNRKYNNLLQKDINYLKQNGGRFGSPSQRGKEREQSSEQHLDGINFIPGEPLDGINFTPEEPLAKLNFTP